MQLGGKITLITVKVLKIEEGLRTGPEAEDVIEGGQKWLGEPVYASVRGFSLEK